jgi:lysophospholipase L1-like esterase
MKIVAVGGLALLGLVAVVATAGFLLIVYQGKRAATGDPHYVAMGSSFAAGIGLGARAPDSPLLCMRTLNGYPQQLARLLDLPLVDVTCSGAVTGQVLRGGQFFQRAQLDVLKPTTKLVTITSGGNDVSYVGDLSFLAARNSGSVSGWLMTRFWKGPVKPEHRKYGKVQSDLVAFVREVRRRAPAARVVIVTYPMILPPSGTCPRLNISEEQAGAMREVGEKLAEATRAAAGETGAILIDMQRLGADHHACSPAPWVNGWIDARGTQFHPTLAGAQATAEAIAEALR